MAFIPYKKKLYIPDSTEPFKLSRSKIDMFLECARCFYLDRRIGVSRPDSFPFNLNSAVDHLLKKEFDIHRSAKTAHPLMVSYKIDAVPFIHKDLDVWRENFVGVQYLDKKNNFIIFGAVDDVWVNKMGELIVVDYKSTSKDTEVNLDADWQIAYKRQMEVYQWLLEKNDHKVSTTGYFVYANATKARDSFEARLEFEMTVIPYTGDNSWIEETLVSIKKCLDGNDIPKESATCKYCEYRTKAGNAFKDHVQKYGAVKAASPKKKK
ncbi:MAG: PD-(D/E)XK nuclease family protein [bacterium]